jgi:hypothetical protein
MSETSLSPAMTSSAQNAGFCDLRSPLQMAKGNWRRGVLIQALVEQTMNSSNSRRTLKRMAAVAAGPVGPVLAPGTTVELSATTRSPLSKAPTHCERGQAVRSDRATLVETSSGRIRGFKRNGVYTFPPRPLASAALRKTLKVQL